MTEATCPTCTAYSREYNVAIANRLVMKARLIQRRMDGHHRDEHFVPRPKDTDFIDTYYRSEHDARTLGL